MNASVKLTVLLFCLALSGFLQADDLPGELVAEHRGHLGQTLPVLDERLCSLSSNRAQALADSGSLSHFDEAGRGPGLQMVLAGYSRGEFGEILGAGDSLAAVWSSWLTSPTHRAVLEEPGWELWGWGEAESEGSRVWVIRFWKP